MRRLDRLREMACDVRKVLRHWWLWYFEDAIYLVIGVVFLAAIAYAIAYSVRISNQQRKVRDERTVANTLFEGRFEHVEVDGHEYVLWSRGSDSGITHSPKCKCIRKDAPHEQRAD